MVAILGARVETGDVGWLTWLVELPGPQQHALLLSVQGVLGLCLVALWLVGLRGLAGWRLPADPLERRYVVALVALVVFAIALRYGIPPDGTEIRWRQRWSYMPLGEVNGYTDLRKYGVGLPYLTWLVVAVEGGSQPAVLGMHTAFSAFTLLPLAGVVRRLSGSAVAGVCAAFAFAVAPLTIRFARVDSPFAPDHFFVALCLYAVLRAAEDRRRRWFVVAVASAVIAAQLRVESALIVVEAFSLAALLGRRFPWSDRRTWIAVGCGVLFAVPHLVTVVPQLVFELGTRYSGFRTLLVYEGEPCWTVVNPDMQGWPLIALAAVGVVAGPGPWWVRAWILGWVFINVNLDMSTCPRSVGFSTARYQMRAQPWAAMLSGLGLAALLDPALREAEGRSRAAMGAALGLAAVVVGGRIASVETVMSREHTFLMEHLPEVPSPCRIYGHTPNRDNYLIVEGAQSRMLGLDHAWIQLDGFVRDVGASDTAASSPCAWYYKAASCARTYLLGATRDRDAVCDDFEAAMSDYLVPVATASLIPDRVSPMAGPLVRPGPVPIGLYRIAPGAPLPARRSEPLPSVPGG